MPPKKTLSGQKLLIVESSSKCAIIEKYLGDGYKCISCNGHLRIIDGLKSIDVKNDFRVEYTVDPDKKAHLSKMKEIISTFPPSQIILATDHDREGEAIAWHLCDIFGLPVETTPRILFHEITRPALQAAVANPYHRYEYGSRPTGATNPRRLGRFQNLSPIMEACFRQFLVGWTLSDPRFAARL